VIDTTSEEVLRLSRRRFIAASGLGTAAILMNGLPAVAACSPFGEASAQSTATGEKAAAVIVPSRDSKNGGGSGGTIFDDTGATLGRTPYLADTRTKIPVVVAAIESYGRLYRLTQAHAPVSVEIDVETKFTGEHQHGYNTVAEIPGADPKLKEQVVMVGGHLDSWTAGTGATDNGAGPLVGLPVKSATGGLTVSVTERVVLPAPLVVLYI